MLTDLAWLKKLEASKPFSEGEAWWLFRAAAISEAVGWTILIIGLTIREYHLPGQTIAVPIAGQIHGTLFLIYFGIVIAVYSSLGWSRRKFLLALMAGVPPYGTLVYEQWAAHIRRSHKRRVYVRNIVYAVMTASL